MISEAVSRRKFFFFMGAAMIGSQLPSGLWIGEYKESMAYLNRTPGGTSMGHYWGPNPPKPRPLSDFPAPPKFTEAQVRAKLVDLERDGDWVDDNWRLNHYKRVLSLLEEHRGEGIIVVG